MLRNLYTVEHTCFVNGYGNGLLNLRDLRDLPISEGDIVGTKRCV